MSNMEEIRHKVSICSKCGQQYIGRSTCGIGSEKKGVVLLIGMNPWAVNGTFKKGSGIILLMNKFEEWGFKDFFFDNIVKCEMPDGKPPKKRHVRNCKQYLYDQITELSPMYQIIFGKFAANAMGFQYLPWVEPVRCKIITVPHFSSILYGSTNREKEEYYKRLHTVLFHTPKQKEMF